MPTCSSSLQANLKTPMKSDREVQLASPAGYDKENCPPGSSKATEVCACIVDPHLPYLLYLVLSHTHARAQCVCTAPRPSLYLYACTRRQAPTAASTHLLHALLRHCSGVYRAAYTTHYSTADSRLTMQRTGTPALGGSIGNTCGSRTGDGW